jgi:hypothetical protein
MAWLVWALCVVLVASAMLLEFFNPSVPPRDGSVIDGYIGIALLAYPMVGAIVASRRPKNLVGWILCGIGLLFGVEAFTEAYAYYTPWLRGLARSLGGCTWLGSQISCSGYRVCSWARHC